MNLACLKPLKRNVFLEETSLALSQIRERKEILIHCSSHYTVWYVMGILITFCSTLLEEMGATFEAKSSTAIAFAYIGITVGDLASGLLSQYLKSRKKVMFIFVALLAISTTVFLTTADLSETWFLTITLIMGFFTGYWAVFITTASELFGTNIRATATTSAPNFVRVIRNTAHLFKYCI